MFCAPQGSCAFRSHDHRHPPRLLCNAVSYKTTGLYGLPPSCFPRSYTSLMRSIVEAGSNTRPCYTPWHEDRRMRSSVISNATSSIMCHLRALNAISLVMLDRTGKMLNCSAVRPSKLTAKQPTRNYVARRALGLLRDHASRSHTTVLTCGECDLGR